MLRCGKKIPDFSCETAAGREESFLAGLSAKRTILVFHRFIGCRLCQLSLWDAARCYPALREADREVAYVVQSGRENASPVLERLGTPFKVICDPEGQLYRLFDVRPAASQKEMGDPRVIAAEVARAERLHLEKGVLEGDPLQRPALFLIDPEGKICFEHYPQTVYGLPALSELASLE